MRDAVAQLKAIMGLSERGPARSYPQTERRFAVDSLDRLRSSCERSCAIWPMSAADLAIVDCSSCFVAMENCPVSIAFTELYREEGLPCASAKPDVVPSARVR